MRLNLYMRTKYKVRRTKHWLTLVFHSLSPLFEHLSIPDKPSARISRQLEILRQFQTISGTRFLAQRAEHATRSIKDKFIQNFFAARFAGDDDLHVHGNDIDAVFRTCQRAEVARDAERVVRLRIHVEARRPMKS